MEFSTVNSWLDWISSIHAQEIELGLDRVKMVADRLHLLAPQQPVIVVGGTNGKGSTVAGLEAIYQANGYQVGAFTSPILIKHNEYVRINGQLASDEEFCNAYQAINTARADISLTPFEFHTLAALWIFHCYPLNVLIMEVGLGGRLDAVNILDSDLSIITSIGIDHTEYLGPTRETIGFEKAGIFRSAKPAVYGDLNPPQTVLDQAEKLGTVLFQQGKDFQYQDNDVEWSFTHGTVNYQHLPKNALAIQNMANVLMAITLLQPLLPVSEAAINRGLSDVHLTGRIQIIPGEITKVFDVSHNPAAIELLATKLRELNSGGKVYAVFSMLADKDILQSLKFIRSDINKWFIAPLPVKRAATQEKLLWAFKEAEINSFTLCDSIVAAYQCAIAQAKAGDYVVVFGSFHTVAEVLQHLQ